MKIEPRKVAKFQMGGEMPAGEGGAPAEGGAPDAGGGQDPMQEIIMGMQQAMQAGDCEGLMQVCGAFLQLIAEAQGAGAAADQPQPTFARRGGRLVRI